VIRSLTPLVCLLVVHCTRMQIGWVTLRNVPASVP